MTTALSSSDTIVPASMDKKIEDIENACRQADVTALRKLAASDGGLVTDGCRQTAWPILLGCSSTLNDDQTGWKQLDRHRDEDQVKLDVDRSFVYYPKNITERQREAYQSELQEAITGVLRHHPMLHYFQGYHDIVQVLLLVLGVDKTIAAASRLSLLRIRDYMLPTMTATEHHLQLLPAILYAADPAVCAHLSHTRPFFALAATLTLYAHDIEEYGDIARLFDFLLASEAVVPLYLFAVVVVSRREELLDIPSDEPEMLHSILSKLPKPLDLDHLINKTCELFHSHPPERLRGRAWSHVPTSSVLKTTRDFNKARAQTLSDGERFFVQEAAQIRKLEANQRRQKHLQALARRYRRPMTWTGAALIVAFAAVYLRGSNIPSFMLASSRNWQRLGRSALEIWQRWTSSP